MKSRGSWLQDSFWVEKPNRLSQALLVPC